MCVLDESALVPVTVTVNEPVETGAVKVRTDVPELALIGLTVKVPPLAPDGRVTERLMSSANPPEEVTVTV